MCGSLHPHPPWDLWPVMGIPLPLVIQLGAEQTYLGRSGSSSGKALGYGRDDPGSNPGVGGVKIVLHSFVSRLVPGSTQPPIE